MLQNQHKRIYKKVDKLNEINKEINKIRTYIDELNNSCISIIKEKDIGRDDRYAKELSVVEDKLYELDEDASNLVVKYYKNKLKQLEHEFSEIQK